METFINKVFMLPAITLPLLLPSHVLHLFKLFFIRLLRGQQDEKFAYLKNLKAISNSPGEILDSPMLKES